jgi:hypothetical protein
MASNYWSWKAIKDWFEFFLILAAFCACGYIGWKQLIYLYLMLILGGVAAGLAPIVSPLYRIPEDWMGLAPSLDKLLEISQDKVGQLNHLEESELRNAREDFNRAKEIIARYAQKHPELINEYPEIGEIYKAANVGQQSSQQIYQERVDQRQIDEERQRQERFRWEQCIESERRRRGYNNGAPPIGECQCPQEYPIRATEERRIYYVRGERIGMKVDWCFESERHAETDGFRRPERQPPRYQRRGR